MYDSPNSSQDEGHLSNKGDELAEEEKKSYQRNRPWMHVGS
jgi:hypothetical protein